jgi:mannose-6-phosphate isomerase-like protein (cupin superfamily)
LIPVSSFRRDILKGKSMKLHTLAFAAALALPATASLAQTSDPPDLTVLAKSAQIQSLIADAAKSLKPGQTLFVQKIIGIEPFTAYLEYRTGMAGGGTHEKEDEIFYVVDGAGTFVTGGHLVPGAGPNLNVPNMPNNVIEGGHAHAIAKGDMLIVPHNTPHQVSAVNGKLIMISMHLPRPVPDAGAAIRRTP